MNAEKDYYKILGLTNQAEISTIKKEYKKLAIQLHPDKTKGDKIKEERFKSVTEAYTTLSNPEKKQKYDQQSQHGRNYAGGNPFAGFGGGEPFGGFGDGMRGNPFDIFRDVFGQDNPFEQPRQRQQEFHENLDIQMNVVISLRDVYKADSIKIKYNRNIHCKDCKGTGFDNSSHSDPCEMCNGRGHDHFGRPCKYCQGLGRVFLETCKKCNSEKIESELFEFNLNAIENVRESKTQYLEGYGHQSKYYRGKKGTLVMNIIYKHVQGYEIINEDLYYDLDVHYYHAIKGKKIEYEHLDGKILNLKIPKKTKDGDTIKIKEKGLIINGTKRRKDLYFRINIIIDYSKE